MPWSAIRDHSVDTSSTLLAASAMFNPANRNNTTLARPMSLTALAEVRAPTSPSKTAGVPFVSIDEDAVLREAFRVLKPGGRFAVSDVVVRGQVPADVRRSMELWVGCIAGALEESDYVAKLHVAGFTDVDIEPWRVYRIDDARSFLSESGFDVDRLAPAVEGKFASAASPRQRPAADRPAARRSRPVAYLANHLTLYAIGSPTTTM
jgi:SAM-dependent methyltransferase